MTSPGNWFSYVRQILELLYYLSGVAIAVAAFLGLKQLEITRQIARTNATREAFKLAADECRTYGQEVVPLLTAFVTEYDKSKLTFLSSPPNFAIENGEIVKHNFDVKLLDAEVPRILVPLVSYLNAVEAFAIFFTAGVADEDIAFQETAVAFCKATISVMPAYFQMRRTNAARFESTIKLFDLWSKRLHVKAMSPAIKSMEDFIKSVGNEKIRPIGT
jgi:hypothetical protein